MQSRKQNMNRVIIGGKNPVMKLPNLLDIQLSSYEYFLQRETKRLGEEVKNQGLESIFKSIFPIESPNGDMRLEYEGYILDESSIKYSIEECKEKGSTYLIPLKALLNLVFLETGEIRQKEIFFGEIPLMTEEGSFVINGTERVVVSQLHRSPGVLLSHDKEGVLARIIPYRGSWLEFEISAKKELIHIKVDKRKKLLATLFLRLLGYSGREDILAHFYKSRTITLSEDDNSLSNAYVMKNYYTDKNQGKRLLRAGEQLHPHKVSGLMEAGITTVELIDFSAENSLRSTLILNCLEHEEVKYLVDDQDDLSKEEVAKIAHDFLNMSDSSYIENAERELAAMFFSTRRYDLGKVGRYKLNQVFEYKDPPQEQVLIREDIINTIAYLIRVYIGDRKPDDIDHLGNRRVRSVGELFQTQLKAAFANVERVAKNRMELRENDMVRPQDLIAIKYIVSSIKDFFGSSQLAQFMDQVNPLSEVTHKRRLNALGPGGVTRDRASFEVRDVHYTHYGRICPIETPEGPNIGLIVSLANYTRVNEFGFLETPYQKVFDGKVSDQIIYLSAIEEERYNIAQASVERDENGHLLHDHVSARKGGEYIVADKNDVQFVDVSPAQIVSISASLIPFLEHDDANRALMGSNMQRQAVPLLFTEAPRVGTGMEQVVARDSGIVQRVRRAGEVIYVSSEKVLIKPHESDKEDDVDSYIFHKYRRTNQDTSSTQKPLVQLSDNVVEGDPISDGAATSNAELALGRNVLVGFLPWHGHNFEDAILISENIVKEDVFTSVHIHVFLTEVRETKFGPEIVTPDIPNTPEHTRMHLNEDGIICVGARVKYNDILVGKVTPKSDIDNTPEFRLLNQIFGEKAREVRDTSLRVPHGIEGVVIDVQMVDRLNGEDLSPGVVKVIKVFTATKCRLKEGDKMAGHHGNKGVVSKILPVEDMPFMEDGTPLDICLNPLGVPSRMNIGQILEMQLGWAAVALDQWFAVPVFESPSHECIAEKLAEAGLPENSKTPLYDGKTGECFKNKVSVGYMYMLKLHHLVDDKVHARSTGPYSLLTQQPLGGKAQFGGQRLGEMEVWALESYGAAHTLRELLTVKSDDIRGRTKIYEAIVKGETFTDIGIPESFNVLVHELRGLGLDISIYDEKDMLIPLTERDEELAMRSNTEF